MDFDKYFPKAELKRFVCKHDFVPDGQLICRTCGVQVPELVNPFVPFRERSALNTPYCKTSHFKSKLDELCCTEPVVIPDEIMEICKDCNLPEAVRVTLQKHRLKQHYGHIYKILKQKGVDIPTISFDEREKLILLFKRVMVVYGRLGRPNIICIHFVLAKLFLEIDRPDIIPFLFVLKSPKKNREYSELWNSMESF